MPQRHSQATTNSSNTSPAERRSFTRSPNQNRATTLIQMVLADSGRAAEELAQDLRAGGDPAMVGAVLWAAEAMARLRGIELGEQIREIVGRLEAEGYRIN